MKKLICVLLLICVCFSFVGCSNGATVRVVEVEKIVEVPVEVEVEKIVEVYVEKEVKVLVPFPVEKLEVTDYFDYDWVNLKEGDKIENVLCSSNGVAKIYTEKVSMAASSDYKSAQVYHQHYYNITEHAAVRLCSSSTNNRLEGIVTGVVQKIEYEYNTLGYINYIYLYII